MYVIYENDFKVRTIYYNPTPGQMAEPGMHIEGAVPQLDTIPGLSPVLKIDLEKARLYYDHERPDTWEGRIIELQKENAELKLALAELAEAQGQSQTATQLALVEIVESLGGEK